MRKRDDGFDKRLVDRDALAEIEAHLEDETQDRIAAGETPEAARAAALRTLGDYGKIEAEYGKLYGASRIAQARNVMSHVVDGRMVLKLLAAMVVGMLFFLAGTVLEGGHPGSMLRLASFLLVVGMTAGLVLLQAPWRDVLSAYAGTLRHADADPKIFAVVGKSFLYAGLTGAALGFVLVVRHLKMPELIGPGVALSVTSLLYGFLGYLAFGLGFETARSGVTSAAPASAATRRGGWLQAALPLALIAVALGAGLMFALREAPRPRAPRAPRKRRAGRGRRRLHRELRPLP
jgi:hypothetical protein